MAAEIQIDRISTVHGGFVVEGTSTIKDGQRIIGQRISLRPEPLTGLVYNARASEEGLIRITSRSHGLRTGDRVVVENVLGTLEANGTWFVAVVNPNEFDLNASEFRREYQGSDDDRWTRREPWRDVRVEDPTPGRWSHEVLVNGDGLFEVQARLFCADPSQIVRSSIETITTPSAAN